MFVLERSLDLGTGVQWLSILFTGMGVGIKD